MPILKPIHKATKAQRDRAVAHSHSSHITVDGWAHATMRDGDFDKATKPDHPAFATPSGSTDSGDPIPTDWQVSLEYKIQFIEYAEGEEIPVQMSFSEEPTLTKDPDSDDRDVVIQAKEGSEFDRYNQDSEEYTEPGEAGEDHKFWATYISDANWDYEVVDD